MSFWNEDIRVFSSYQTQDPEEYYKCRLCPHIFQAGDIIYQVTDNRKNKPFSGYVCNTLLPSHKKYQKRYSQDLQEREPDNRLYNKWLQDHGKDPAYL